MRHRYLRPSLPLPEIYLYRTPVDFRKQTLGLAVSVEQELGHNPFTGALYAQSDLNLGEIANWITRLTEGVVLETRHTDGSLSVFSILPKSVRLGVFYSLNTANTRSFVVEARPQRITCRRYWHC
jgi:hypothetical protein